jgi:hypothetical protein
LLIGLAYASLADATLSERWSRRELESKVAQRHRAVVALPLEWLALPTVEVRNKRRL